MAMPVLFASEPSSRSFWNRATALFAGGGLFAYLVSAVFFQIPPGWLLVLLSAARLLPGAAIGALATRRFGSLHRLALAFPYPTELALFVYSKRFLWLPRDVALYLDGPTTRIIFVASVLLASRWATTAALPREVREQESAPLRRLGTVLFALTALGMVLPNPWEFWFLHYVPEPIAMMGYCAVVGHAWADPRP